MSDKLAPRIHEFLHRGATSFEETCVSAEWAAQKERREFWVCYLNTTSSYVICTPNEARALHLDPLFKAMPRDAKKVRPIRYISQTTLARACVEEIYGKGPKRSKRRRRVIRPLIRRADAAEAFGWPWVPVALLLLLIFFALFGGESRPY